MLSDIRIVSDSYIINNHGNSNLGYYILQKFVLVMPSSIYWMQYPLFELCGCVPREFVVIPESRYLS